MRFTAIDFETANGGRASACSVGLAIVENGQIVRRWSHLIRPDPLFFDPMNVSIHGIAPRDVRNAPSFAELWPTLLSHVSGPLVAHNAAFDMGVLRAALDDADLAYPDCDYVCSRVVAAIAWPERTSHALAPLADFLGISFAHHDAEEDATACALVALHACKRLNSPAIHDLECVCGLRIGRLFPGGYLPCGKGRPKRRSNTP